MSKRFVVASLLLLLSSAFVASTAIAEPSLTAVSVPAKKQGGTYVVPVLINGAITLDFVFDSGAADVSIPADVVLTLIRTGTIQEADFVGTQTYVLADGSKVPSATFRIRSLTVGGITVENVVGSIAPVSGTLLLGQSFLSRFNSWAFDNTKQAIVLQPRSDTLVNRIDQANRTASEFYRSRFLLTGFLLRAAAVCGNDSQRTIEAGLRLLDDPELKAIANAYPQTISKWSEDGAANFNDGVMTDGVRKTCAIASAVRGKIEVSLTRPQEPLEQAALDPGNTAAGRAERFVLKVEELLSKGGAPDPIWLASIYDGRIDYYGKQLSRDSVIVDKRTFGEKWPERIYTIPPGSMTANCSPSTCQVKTLLYFSAHSQIRRITSRGIATLALSLAAEGENFIINGEAGNVLQRQQSRDDDATAITTIEAARQLWMRVPSQDKEQLENYVSQHSGQCAQADPFAFTVTCYRIVLQKLAR